MNPQPLLSVRGLAVEFRRGRRRRPLRAVDDVSFDIEKGETLGLVGESGSGKTTIGNALLGLVKPTAGTVLFEGREIAAMSATERRLISGRLQVVFQDPYSSLNPSRRVGQTIAEPLSVHTDLDQRQRVQATALMLERVGLSAADMAKYPAAFSGGQRQRIAIARALITRPHLVVCDEPVSGLDLSAQAQVLNLLKDLQAEMGLAMLFISHDLAVVRYMATRIAVLLRGKVVEEGTTAKVNDAPEDAYTKRLLAASPAPDPAAQRQARELRRQLQAASATAGGG
jgi:ABC-type glutathione transport system ATPase component